MKQQDNDLAARAHAQAVEFGKCPKDMRDWAEGLGYLALKDRVASGAAIAAQAAATLNMLLAGLAGTLAVGVQVLSPGAGPLAWGAAAVAMYLAVLAMVAMHVGTSFRDAPAVYNRPGSLLKPGATLEQVRVGELAWLDQAIQAQTALNASRALAANRVRLAAGAAPLIFAAAAGWAAWGR